MGFYSRVFLVFLMKESKKRRRKQLGKLMAKRRSQTVNLPGARPLMNPLLSTNAHRHLEQIQCNLTVLVQMCLFRTLSTCISST